MDRPENRQRHPADQPDPDLAELTRLIASVFDVPIAAIAFRVDDGLRLRSSVGLDQPQLPEIMNICSSAIQANAPLTQSLEPAQTLGFYNAVPLKTEGALIIADVNSRPALTPRKASDLQAFSDLAADRLAQSKAERDRKLTSAVFASMNHDIRTPLNGILGMAELLQAAGDLGEHHRRRVEMIRRSGANLLSLLGTLFAFARLETRAIDPVGSTIDLRQSLTDTMEKLQKEATDEAVRFELADHLEKHHLGLGNGPLFRDLLKSFLVSAGKLAKAGPVQITVSAKPYAADGIETLIQADMVSAGSEPISAVLASAASMADLGSSKIDEASLHAILLKKIASIMGGDVRFDRKADSTSTLRLTVPLGLAPEQQAGMRLEHDAPVPAQAIENGEQPRLNREVLVAEDDPDMADLIQDLLEEAGFNATIATDGTSALQIIGQKPIDLVLMDGRMPDMTGLEAARHIRELPDERARIPIIALTGEALSGDKEKYMAAGMDDYLVKPVDYETLIDAIDRCHRRS